MSSQKIAVLWAALEPLSDDLVRLAQVRLRQLTERIAYAGRTTWLIRKPGEKRPPAHERLRPVKASFSDARVRRKQRGVIRVRKEPLRENFLRLVAAGQFL